MFRVFNLKKIAIPAAVLLIILLLITTFMAFMKRDKASWYDEKFERIARRCPQYYMNVSFNSKEKTVNAVMKVKYTNNSNKNLEEVYFYLYPNAFKDENRLPFLEDEIPKVYPNGFDPGYIEVNYVKTPEEGQDLEFHIEDIYMKVIMPQSLKPGRKISLELSFSVKLPNSLGRFGYGQKTYNVCNWYPILAVYDDDGWNLNPYYAIGDPFYSEIALYDVVIEVPKDLVIASTGTQVEIKEKDGGTREWHIKTGLVRDFAWVASTEFQIHQKEVDGTNIYSYYFDEEGSRKALEAAAEAVRFFNSYFGKYPYDTFSVVAADFYIGGMEYPNLVLIDKTLYGGSFLEYIVVHETAHQWWYGLVGSNQIKEAWLDEGLTEYSTIMYYEHRYGKARGARMYNDFVKNRYRFYELTNPKDFRVLRPLHEFRDWRDYDALVYARGAMVFGELREQAGDKTFQRVMRQYFREYIYENSTTEEFIRLWEKETEDFGEAFFNKMLNLPPEGQNIQIPAA